MLVISFPGQLSSEAGKLAQDLRGKLLKLGVPPSEVEVRRENDEAMDAGTILHVALIGFEALALAKAIYEVCFPARSGIRIQSPIGSFEIREPTIDIDKLAAIIATIKGPTDAA